jgi:hypothetical protein
VVLLVGSLTFGFTTGPARAKTTTASGAVHSRLLATDRRAVRFWNARTTADSELLATMDQREDAASRALPPCAQTPAIDPPCTGFDLVTAGAMQPQVEGFGRQATAAWSQVLRDQAWLQAWQKKLARDEDRT